MEQPRRATEMVPTTSHDGTARLNALMLVAATFFASAVFAGVAVEEGLPAIIGALLPWLALGSAAAWWFGASTRERHARNHARTRALDDARTVAVNLLLADEGPAGELAAAAELVLADDPTRAQARALLELSPTQGPFSEPSR